MTKARDNNAVFSGATAPTAPQQRQDFDGLFEVPTETVPLPSSGKVYPEGNALHGLETVDIKSMTSKEEDILTSQALAKKGTILSVLIKSCLMNKQIDPADLLIGDRYAILLAIRITGYGAEYVDDVQCSECEVTSQQQFDMTKFPLKRLTIDPVVPGENLFEFKLPKSGNIVNFRFMTGRDEEEMHTTESKMKKLGLVSDANVTNVLARTVVSVNGISDGNKIVKYVKESMPAADSSALRKYIAKHSPGMLFEQELTCPKCEHKEVVSMPVGLGFLWPNASGQD